MRKKSNKKTVMKKDRLLWVREISVRSSSTVSIHIILCPRVAQPSLPSSSSSLQSSSASPRKRPFSPRKDFSLPSVDLSDGKPFLQIFKHVISSVSCSPLSPRTILSIFFFHRATNPVAFLLFGHNYPPASLPAVQ